jgi:hypothetical protein
MILHRRSLMAAGAAFSAAGALRSVAAQSPATDIIPVTDPKEARAIAAEAYIYFYSLVTMDLTRRQMTNIEPGEMAGRGPMNTFAHIRAYPDANFKEVVRPNFDTLYSLGWLDLTQGPLVVSVPNTHGRYYMLPMLDMWSDVFAVPGKRTTGTEAADYVVAPRGWAGTLPKDDLRIDALTPYVWIIGRTQTNGPADYTAVHEIQNAFSITPLAKRGETPQQPRVVVDPQVDMKTPPKVQVDTMSPAAYFGYAAELLKENPPHDSDWSIMARLARIGIIRGKSFDAMTLDPPARQAIEMGAADGATLMVAKLPTLARVVRGWQMNTDTMGVYGNYYLKRAIIAQVGLGANQPEDAIYPLNLAGADGKPVEGGDKYVMHFEKAELPPVDAFWSLTMYGADGFQVANPLNRFAIGDRDTLKYNPDGSLDLYIQHEEPAADKQANWLPSPLSGVLGITMRLYVPGVSALDGTWVPPPVQRQSAT